MGPLVLLVEDDRLLRWWMTTTLINGGFDVTAPETVDEAVRLAASCPVDILVTDWNLGDRRDGFDVLKHARLGSPRLFAVLITADVNEQLAERARRAGFDRVIQKPFPVSEITALLRARRERRPVPSAEVA